MLRGVHGAGDLIQAGTQSPPRKVPFENNDGKGDCSSAGDIPSCSVPRHEYQAFDAEARKIPVSYTHLDVYKRQVVCGVPAQPIPDALDRGMTVDQDQFGACLLYTSRCV